MLYLILVALGMLQLVSEIRPSSEVTVNLLLFLVIPGRAAVWLYTLM
jgi:hypothetical protein